MIAANYTMDLYCDCETCGHFTGSAEFHPGHATFIGESWTSVSSQARILGWRISKDRTRCFAPKHKIKRDTSSR